MKVSQMAPNQLIIFTPDATYFQSYNTVIVKTTFVDGHKVTILDAGSWDYSRTTAKYRNQFLGETTKQTSAKIRDGLYKLEDLNK